MKVIFYLGASFEAWNSETIKTTGIGGSESLAAEIAKRLARRGHEVIMQSHCLGVSGTFEGVRYQVYDSLGRDFECDVLVAWRRPEVLTKISAKRKIFVATDSHYGPGAFGSAEIDATDRFVVLSEWHRSVFLSVHQNVPSERVRIIRTGVATELFEDLPKKQPGRMAYTSSPNRGLEPALRAMPAILKERPDARLHVYHGFFTPKAFAKQHSDMKMLMELTRLETMMSETPGVTYHGRLGSQELYRQLSLADLWVYPTSVAETSCMAALEAQCAGCRIVTTPLGALKETAPDARFVASIADWAEYTQAVLEELSRPWLPDKSALLAMSARTAYDYEKVVDQYEAELLLAHDNVMAPIEARPSVCLTMVVKNEAHVLPRLIASAKPYINYYCIVDTGSEDDTLSVVRKAMAEAGIAGQFHQRPWVDFSPNRTEALRLAEQTGASYALMLDADMEMAADPTNALGSGTPWQSIGGHDSYLIRNRQGNLEFDRPLLLSLSAPWEFLGKRHEMPTLNRPHREGRIQGVFVKKHGDGHGAGTPDPMAILTRYTEEAALLEAELEREPGNTRTAFYLARTYQDACLMQKAREAYKHRMSMPGGSVEEGYLARLYYARLFADTTQSTGQIIAAFEEAHEYRPIRAEAYHSLAQQLRGKQKFAHALMYAELAAKIEKPPTDQLFLEFQVYDWMAIDEWATCLTWVGKWKEALEVFEQELRRPLFPDTERTRVLANIELCLKQLGIIPPDPPVVPADPPVVVDPPYPGHAPALEVSGWRVILPAHPMLESLREYSAPIEEALRDMPGSGEVWFGAHSPWSPEPPEHAIIYQSEVPESPWFTAEYRRRLRRARAVWDYSSANLLAYEAKEKRHVPLRYSHVLETIPPKAAKDVDIDFGFCGTMNDRRKRIFDELGVKVISGVGPKERDAFLARVKVVVVPHYYPTAPVEQNRIGHLLANGIAVVAEAAPDSAEYPGPVYAAYGDLVQTARNVLAGWHPLGKVGKQIFQARTAKDLLKDVLASSPVASSNAPEVRHLLKLNLGSADAHLPGYVNVDRVEPADLIAYLNRRWPWEDSTVDEIVANDFIEHLSDKIFTMNEAYRVLRPGGLFKIVVPTTDGAAAFQDPTHVSFWNRNSFWYFTDGDAHHTRFAKSYGIEARFRVVHETPQTHPGNVRHLAICLEAIK